MSSSHIAAWSSSWIRQSRTWGFQASATLGHGRARRVRARGRKIRPPVFTGAAGAGKKSPPSPVGRGAAPPRLDGFDGRCQLERRACGRQRASAQLLRTFGQTTEAGASLVRRSRKTVRTVWRGHLRVVLGGYTPQAGDLLHHALPQPQLLAVRSPCTPQTSKVANSRSCVVWWTHPGFA